MPLPRGPRFPTFAGAVRPQPTGKDRTVLGVGSRVLVTSRSGGSGRVTLTDDNGTTALTTIATGVEVEILAWRPRRGGDTRYRVVLTTGGVEGWVGAESLRPHPPAPVPKVAVAVAPSARPVSPIPTASRESQRTRRAPVVAENGRSPKSTRSGRR